MTPEVASPRSVPLDRLVERHAHADATVSIAGVSDYPEVEALARAAAPGEVFKPLTAAVLSWFTERNPAGPGFLVVARSRPGGRLLGHFLFYATRLERWDGSSFREAPAYLYVNLYVAPELRRRGVFTTMLGFGLDVLTEMGVAFAYTVPNPRSSPGFLKFGIPLLGTLPCRMAPAWRAWTALSRVTAGGRTSRVTAQRVDRFDESMAASGRPAAGVRGWRSPAFLNWRFTDRPGAQYSIFRVEHPSGTIGSIVARVLDIQKYRVITVCDLALEPFDAPTIRAALADVQRQLTAERADLVMLQGGPPDARSRRALARAGLVRVPDRFLPQPVAVFGDVPGTRGSDAGLPPLADWCLTPCDWDVF